MSITDYCQGYAATITNRGRRKFARFGGGLTSDFSEAIISPSIEDAYRVARSRCQGLYDVPGYATIDSEGQEIRPTKYPLTRIEAQP